MTGWPQISVAIWLVLSVCGSLGAALPGGKREWIVLTPNHQRIAAAAFGVAALTEATLLWLGGFWQ